MGDTGDGRNPANQLIFGRCPIIYRVLYIPGGEGFQPSINLISLECDSVSAQVDEIIFIHAL